MNTTLCVLSTEELAMQHYMQLAEENKDKVKFFVEELLLDEAERSAE